MAGFKHGSKAVVKVDNSAGALQDLSAYINKAGLDRMLDTAEVTVFGNTSKAFIPGLKDGKFTLDGLWDAVLDAHMNGIVGGTSTGGSTTVEYYPEGTTVGNRKYSFEMFVTTFGVESGVDAANTWKAEIQVTGDITPTTA